MNLTFAAQDTRDKFGYLMAQLDQAVVAFKAEMVAQGLWQHVAITIASDFGRSVRRPPAVRGRRRPAATSDLRRLHDCDRLQVTAAPRTDHGQWAGHGPRLGRELPTDQWRARRRQNLRRAHSACAASRTPSFPLLSLLYMDTIIYG